MRTPENSPKNSSPFKILAIFLSVVVVLGSGIILLALGLLASQMGLIASPLQLFKELFALDSVHIWWYISRASGLMGYLLLWLSMICGFAVSSKIFDPVLERVFTYDFHEIISLLSLGFVGIHAITLAFDHVEPLSLVEILFPFVSSYRPFWTGIGIIGFYLSLLVTVTFYIRSRISVRAFRVIHYLSIAAYIGSLFHSVFAGTDTTMTWVQWMYWGTFLSTIFFTVYWLVGLWLHKRSIVHRGQLQSEYQP